MIAKYEHNPNIDRYWFDMRLSSKKGWAQVDTTEDAYYYGLWLHPKSRRMINFAEGDIVTMRFDSHGEVRGFLQALKQNHSLKGIDPGFNKRLLHDLKRNRYTPYLHKHPITKR